MKVLVLAPALYDTAPGQRFRIEQWARHLELRGTHFTFRAFESERLHRIIHEKGRYAEKASLGLSAFARRLQVLKTARCYDVVFLHREAAIAGPPLIEWLLSRCGIPIVYDFDDPVWLPYRSPANSWLSVLKFGRKTATICRMANVVVAGNQFLAEYARRYSKHVCVVPSTIDMDCYRQKSEYRTSGILTLGWSGSHSTLPFLDSINTVLRRFAATHEYRMLVISHTESFQMEGISGRVICRRWRPDTEGADIAEIDIGLAPLPSSGWTPWRCQGKVLQYMAAGVPTVASPVGVVRDYIQDGVNGFLAATDDEWLRKLAMLAASPELRRQIGERGRETITQRYSAGVWAPKVGEIIESAARGSRQD